MSLLIKKITKNFYRLLISENNTSRMIEKKIKNVLLPFGLEKYNDKYLIYKKQWEEFLVLAFERNK